MCPENVSQRRIHQVRSRVIANDARPPFRVRHNRYAIPHAQRLLRHNFVRHEPRHGIKRPLHFREQLRLRVVVERAGIRHLPARLRINRRAVQHYFAAFARFQFIGRAFFCDDGFNPAILRAGAVIKVRLGLDRLRQLRVRRIRLFVRTLPGTAAALALGLQFFLERCFIQNYAAGAQRLSNEIKREAIGVVKSKCLIASIDRLVLRL